MAASQLGLWSSGVWPSGMLGARSVCVKRREDVDSAGSFFLFTETVPENREDGAQRYCAVFPENILITISWNPWCEDDIFPLIITQKIVTDRLQLLLQIQTIWTGRLFYLKFPVFEWWCREFDASVLGLPVLPLSLSTPTGTWCQHKWRVFPFTVLSGGWQRESLTRHNNTQGCVSIRNVSVQLYRVARCILRDFCSTL